MTVSELIKELEDMPQEAPVIVNYREITHVHFQEASYCLCNVNQNGYTIDPAVVLE